LGCQIATICCAGTSWRKVLSFTTNGCQRKKLWVETRHVPVYKTAVLRDSMNDLGYVRRKDIHCTHVLLA